MEKKSLIITEKPSVAQEFAKVLGVSGRNDGYIENGSYVITWCVGHLIQMVYPEVYDEKYKKWNLEDLPFLPSTYKYDIIPDVKKQYHVIEKMLHRNDIDTVYWAGDSGREGQYIEELVRRFSGVRSGMKELRVWIDSQTEEEILRGVREAKPMSDYDGLGNSGVMRAIEDYSMGINFSRGMTVKYGNMVRAAAGIASYKAIAVGRVMSCVLGMVVDREREIRNFKETPFYRLIGNFSEAKIESEWKAVEGSDYFESPLLYKENGFKERKDALMLKGNLYGKPAFIDGIEKTNSNKKAPLLFNLAELQNECSKLFKISPDDTLKVAQALYEKKLTTYPRTDARVLSTAVAKVIDQNIKGLKRYAPIAPFADKILDEGLYKNIAKTNYTDDSKVTDHYAIIPTGQLSELGSLTEIQRKVFDLVVRRFLCAFYPAAVYLHTKITIRVGKEKFFASTKALTSAGYLEVYGKMEEDEEATSNDLSTLSKTAKKGDPITVNGISIKEGKTTPPKRYTSGSIILAMENAGQLIEDEELRAQIKGCGIGTSATRAEIIKKLIDIGYLKLDKKTQILAPENFGEMVYEVVSLTVPALLNPKMTASWEQGLEGIAKNTINFSDYRKKLDDFIRVEIINIKDNDLSKELVERIKPFVAKGVDSSSVLSKYKVHTSGTAKPPAEKMSTSLICPKCKKTIIKYDWGWGCSGFSTGCKFSVSSVYAKRETKIEDVKTIVKKGKTDKLSGFISNKGTSFEAYLEWDNKDKRIKMSFS